MPDLAPYEERLEAAVSKALDDVREQVLYRYDARVWESDDELALVAAGTPDDTIHSGIMIALQVDEADQLVVEGGDPVEQIHMTLAFLGDVDEQPEGVKDRVLDVMRNFTFEPFDVELTHVGVLGDDDDPAMALEPEDPTLLAAMRAKLVEALEAAGVEYSDRWPFRAHVTLGYWPIEKFPYEPGPMDQPVTVRAHTIRLHWGDDEPVPNGQALVATAKVNLGEIYNPYMWEEAVNRHVHDTMMDLMDEVMAEAIEEEKNVLKDARPTMDAVRLRALQEEIIANLVEWDEGLGERIGRSIEQGIRKGWGVRELRKHLEEIGISENSARIIARTELNATENAARVAWWRISDAPVYKRWSATHDNRTRVAHRHAHDQTVTRDGLFELVHPETGEIAYGDFPGDPKLPLWARLQCFPPSQEVDVIATGAMRSEYAGQLVTVRTASGNELTATPNHPVLTRRGWVAIGSLDPSDQLLSRREPDGAGLPDPEVGDRPALAGEVYEAVKLAGPPTLGGSEGHAPQVVDFDGNLSVGHSDVQVVGVDGMLSFGRKPEELEEFAQLARGVARGEVGLAGNEGSLAGIGEPLAVGLGNGTGFEANVGQAGNHRRATDAELLAYGQNRMSGLEEADYLVSVGAAVGVMPGPSPTDGLQAHGVEAAGDRRARYAQLLADPPQGESGVGQGLDVLVELTAIEEPGAVTQGAWSSTLSGLAFWDVVVGIHETDYNGPVYDFETAEGLFSAGGIIVHNCRCSVRAMYAEQLSKAFVAANPLPIKTFREESLELVGRNPTVQFAAWGWDWADDRQRDRTLFTLSQMMDAGMPPPIMSPFDVLLAGIDDPGKGLWLGMEALYRAQPRLVRPKAGPLLDVNKAWRSIRRLDARVNRTTVKRLDLAVNVAITAAGNPHHCPPGDNGGRFTDVVASHCDSPFTVEQVELILKLRGTNNILKVEQYTRKLTEQLDNERLAVALTMPVEELEALLDPNAATPVDPTRLPEVRSLEQIEADLNEAGLVDEDGMVARPCPRCNGTGQTTYKHVAEGVCFRCMGREGVQVEYVTATEEARRIRAIEVSDRRRAEKWATELSEVQAVARDNVALFAEKHPELESLIRQAEEEHAAIRDKYGSGFPIPADGLRRSIYYGGKEPDSPFDPPKPGTFDKKWADDYQEFTRRHMDGMWRTGGLDTHPVHIFPEPDRPASSRQISYLKKLISGTDEDLGSLDGDPTGEWYERLESGEASTIIDLLKQGRPRRDLDALTASGSESEEQDESTLAESLNALVASGASADDLPVVAFAELQVAAQAYEASLVELLATARLDELRGETLALSEVNVLREDWLESLHEFETRHVADDPGWARFDQAASFLTEKAVSRRLKAEIEAFDRLHEAAYDGTIDGTETMTARAWLDGGTALVASGNPWHCPPGDNGGRFTDKAASHCDSPVTEEHLALARAMREAEPFSDGWTEAKQAVFDSVANTDQLTYLLAEGGAPKAAKFLDFLTADPDNPEPGIARRQMWGPMDPATGVYKGGFIGFEDAEINVDTSQVAEFLDGIRSEGDLEIPEQVVLDVLNEFPPHLRVPNVVFDATIADGARYHRGITDTFRDENGDVQSPPDAGQEGGGTIRISPDMLLVSPFGAETPDEALARRTASLESMIRHENGHHIDILLSHADVNRRKGAEGWHDGGRQELQRSWAAAHEQAVTDGDLRLDYLRAWNRWVEYDVDDLLSKSERPRAMELIAEHIRYSMEGYDIPGAEQVTEAMLAVELLPEIAEVWGL